ncbi:MAG: putative HNHc nuclease [Clostridium sp.]
MIHYGNITKLTSNGIYVELEENVMREVLRLRKGNTSLVEIRLNDPRRITNDQRKKFYATLKDIHRHTGWLVEELKDIFKAEYMCRNALDSLSLSDCSITDARGLINLVMQFVVHYGIPLTDFGVNRTDDINEFLYCCIMEKKCCVCGSDMVHVHHCTGSKVGMGNNRNKIDNIGRYIVTLCAKHHDECHVDEIKFMDKWHIYGIKVNEEIAEKLNL